MIDQLAAKVAIAIITDIYAHIAFQRLMDRRCGDKKTKEQVSADIN